MKGLINLIHMLVVTTLLYYIAEQKVPKNVVNILIVSIILYHLYLFAQKNGYIEKQ